MTALLIKPERLNFIHFVTASHIHTDHLDPDTIRPLLDANPELKLVIPKAEQDAVFAKLSPCVPTTIGLVQGDTIELDPFRISAIASAHEQNRHGFGRPKPVPQLCNTVCRLDYISQRGYGFV